MASKRKALVDVKVVGEEVSGETIEAFIEALEGREKFFTVEELEKLIKKKGQRDR